MKCLLPVLELLVWSSVQFYLLIAAIHLFLREAFWIRTERYSIITNIWLWACLSFDWAPKIHNKNLALLITTTSCISQTTFLSKVCFDNATSGVLVCHTMHMKLKTWAKCFKMHVRGGSYLKNLQTCSIWLHEKKKLIYKDLTYFVDGDISRNTLECLHIFFC